MSGIPYCVLLFRVDGALLAILALALELDVAVNQSKQGVVAADTDIDARMDVRASLANQNVAREDELTARFTPSLLDSESRPFLVEPPPFL